jgi:hypothetical protein
LEYVRESAATSGFVKIENRRVGCGFVEGIAVERNHVVRVQGVYLAWQGAVRRPVKFADGMRTGVGGENVSRQGVVESELGQSGLLVACPLAGLIVTDIKKHEHGAAPY